MATATYIPIATQTLGSAATSITFSSIPSTYTDLRLVFSGATVGGGNFLVQYNGDTATNYSFTDLYGTGSSANATYGTTQSSITLTQAGGIPTTIVMMAFDIFSYASSINKTCLATYSNDENGGGTVELTVGLWRSTAAITSIKIFPGSPYSFASNSTATLWGI
jgi:hypothetical protein